MRPYRASSEKVDTMDSSAIFVGQATKACLGAFYLWRAAVASLPRPKPDRLVEFKRKYDPNNLFRLNLSIRP
jgi:hypothetical protein